ncbi:YjbH domain-containing protein [Vannielia sp.]|uniref:YjbH domain-containing protein n=1 Tax=Vannielia sp. TaxID=2813045 RepID=UPI00261090EC|nr:YjbH domain-containing protein [Vannielia sp.]MDF1871130.1 YjbH domain-containing protein [Vannielia sp.]
MLAGSGDGATARERLSFYGTPGLVDMPTAGVLPDGSLALTTAHYSPVTRNTLAFQITPRILGTFRYSAQGRLEFAGQDYYDRSFDLHFLLREEEGYWPAIALGLRDFGGTGIYSGEYLVASKHITPRFRVTGGIGWGRFAGRGTFDNPLGVFSESLETRPESSTRTGQFSAKQWFRGPAALFGGVEWAVSDQLTFVAEYSSDLYELESQIAMDAPSSAYNFGLTYAFRNGVDLSAYYLYGNAIGISASYVIDPNRPRSQGGQEAGPPTLLPRNTVAAQSWNLRQATAPTVPANAARDALEARLAAQSIRLLGYERRGDTLYAEVESERFNARAQEAGRTFRLMANTAHPSVETFALTLSNNGQRQTTITLSRRDLEALETDLEGGWHLLARSDIRDSVSTPRPREVTGAYPKFSWTLAPYLTTSLFDPDEPLRYAAGARLSAAYSPRPGLTFAGQLSQPAVNTIGESTRTSNSVLPHVRSDATLYAQGTDLRLDYATAEYMFRPGKDLFGRVSVGYLEAMFGGVSGELLWYPLNSRLALGVEINYAVQREFDQGLSFQDYSVWTGHASAYYDLGKGYKGQIDAGRYLAGDWGATFTLSRQFNNGFTVGAFATFTDVSYDDFGEGSFDKGIFIEVPLAWIIGRPTLRTVNQTLRPVLRDGGARLNVRNRLYDTVSPYRGAAVAASWGKFLR